MKQQLVEGFINLVREAECSCLVNLPQGRNGTVASAAGTKLSFSHPPGTGSAHKSWEAPNSRVIMDGV